jgi:hypothetical protein
MCGLPLRTEPTRIHDVIQRRHSILRNCPILGHVRFMLEAIRPELQQYFIERNFDGRPFDREEFRQKAAHESIKCVSLKLSQGAKPGIGGVLPGAKVTQEIADARSVPKGQTRVSPPGHKVFSTPRELVRFIAEMRELAGGKPAGFKLCVGLRHELLAICKAMVEEGTGPDFIIVDGSEGGTGAAPGEYEDHVGTPLTDGLMMLDNALVGCGLRDQIRIGASGKIATGSDIVTNPEEVSLPPKVKPGQAWGFAIAKLTETLESRG